MTKDELFKYIEKKYIEWYDIVKDDDVELSDGVLIDIFGEILAYAKDNKHVIPGYDLDEVFDKWSLVEGVDEFDPDEVVSVWELYCEIALKMQQEEISVSPEFSEICQFFERKFWAHCFDDEI